MTISETIRKRRRELELSQAELAKRSGISSAGMICDFEKGRKDLSVDRLMRVLKALGLKLVVVEAKP